ncbi:hypothetical protein QR680_004639 [Steinernema hermaphroditum]|uniref:C-type lectin domain-containing protein n=1 Tax=Steinernema hermaphroditum TaxID=289476 RepID=A0AA39HQR9_9BILA|nr:hypothetical protein QR680_004639 [Steinernema hermaphroditum]
MLKRIVGQLLLVQLVQSCIPLAQSSESQFQAPPGGLSGKPSLSEKCANAVHCFNNIVYHVIEKELTWHLAQFECQRIGGNLASILSEEESVLIGRILSNYPSIKRSQFTVWIGGIGRMRAGKMTFSWKDGKSFNYTNFYARQLSNIAGNITDKCGNATNCHRDYIYHVNLKPLDWNTAVDECMIMGGHLTSILDEEESIYISELMFRQNIPYEYKYQVWIGGYRNTRRGRTVFEWIDRKPFGYTNFYDKQPSNVRENNCLEIFSATYRKWVNYPCWYLRPSVCKIPIENYGVKN